MGSPLPMQHKQTEAPKNDTSQGVQLAVDNGSQLEGKLGNGLSDNRAQAIAQRRLSDIANNSNQAKKLQAYQRMAQTSKRTLQLNATRTMMDAHVLRSNSSETDSAKGVVQTSSKTNNTGLSESLKSGIENLSGLSMNHVKVHYNSSKPAQLNAHAYAQGSEIHVAPGQEQHVPHEAWHVVQQAQGRVRPTMQKKGGIPVNDDRGLEEEADRMGLKAMQSRPVQLSDNNKGASANVDGQYSLHSASTQHQVPVQRKIDFSGEDPLRPDFLQIHIRAEALHAKVKQAIEKNFIELNAFFPDYEEVKAELDRKLAFANNLWDLVNSSIDYGEINLDNPQHVASYFQSAKKFLNKNYRAQQKKDQLESSELDKKKKPWELHKEFEAQKKQTLDPAKTFQVALLGTGASIANYINVNGRSLDPRSTVIIGQVQPWNPRALKSRGISFVNHPMHMISPKRSHTQLPKKSDGTDEEFEGNALALSKDIAYFSSRFTTVNAEISKVSRLPNKWYEIQSGRGTYYALKVVSGLGIGPHKFDNIKSNKHYEEIDEKDRDTEKRRVMDLDEFQRQLNVPTSNIMQDYTERKKLGRILLIGVAGPNAGVDAAYTASNLGMGVDWVVTGGPAIAEGMGNKIKNKGWVDLYFDYLNGWTISGDRVKMDISGKWKKDVDRVNAGQEFVRKNGGWRVSESKNKLVDYLVIAQGPAVEKVWNTFDPSARKDLSLQYDTSGRFGISTGSTTSSDSIDVSLKHSNYNIYWKGIEPRVKKVLKDSKITTQIKSVDKLLISAQKILEVKEFAPVTLSEGTATGLAASDNSLEIIGGSAIRLLDYIDVLVGERNKKEEDYKKLGADKRKLNKEIVLLNNTIPNNLNQLGNAQKMRQLVKTLSAPTILNNDQLTPLRAQIEALIDYVPGYVGMEESNFVTDDQTMIALQIADRYGNIPPTLANWVTQKIIEDRQLNRVEPGTSNGSRAFVNKWKTKLNQLNELFSIEKIKQIAE
ncbi:DUF4157 domain-containing protein [Undibacterium sp. Ji50W]|uniref:eCIS core domain-containing protein n=1 Tax=Undibacterium sp. Ji50W TaxID=3413041 RepID=UPI003BEFA3C6